MLVEQFKPNIIVLGPIFPEPVQVIIAIPMGTSVKLVGKGLNTNQVHELILNAEQLAQLNSSKLVDDIRYGGLIELLHH